MIYIAKSKYFYFFTICILLIGIQVAFAGDSFQNNLLKADVKKNSLGGVNLTLYTSKPYNDSVTVNKKGDNEYVILMPETSNSLTARPSLKSASDVVSKIEVKTQQYSGKVKGYTKMVISTTKPIEITPHVQTINSSDYELSEKDYNDLLAQSKKQMKYPKKEVKQTSVAKKENVGKDKKVKTTSMPVKKTILAAKTKNSIQKLTTGKRNSEFSKKLKEESPRLQKIKKTKPKNASRQIETPRSQVSKPVAVVSKVVKPNAEIPTKETSQPVVLKTETPNVQTVNTQTKTINTQATNIEQKVTVPISKRSKVERRLHKYKRIIKNNIYTVLGLIAAAFVLLLLMARKMTKNMQNQKESFVSNLDEKPVVVTDYTEKISDDMTWKEKFQTYVEATNQSSSDEVEKESNPVSTNEDLDELFSSDSLQEETQEDDLYEEFEPPVLGVEEIEEALDSDDFDEIVKTSSMSNILDNVDQESSIDDLFGEDEDFMSQVNISKTPIEEDIEEEAETIFEQPISKVIEKEEPVEVVKSEFIIDDGKGFYLVDFDGKTALIGHIEDEIFVLKRFGKKIESPIQARLDERKGNSLSYMTRVGNFKAIVEVTPEKMNLLIEL